MTQTEDDFKSLDTEVLFSKPLLPHLKAKVNPP